ncbi:MAG: phosphoribosyltransferase family protein [Bacillota bacterium]
MELKYKGQEYYDLEISGFHRKLPVVHLKDNIWIASFVMLGDVNLVNFCAGALATKLAKIDFDYIVGPEAKVIPLLQSMATFLGNSHYVVCRKQVKGYMKDPVELEVESITTPGKQKLVLGGSDVERIKGKKVVLIDDVVSTGGTFDSMDSLMEKVGAEVIGRAAVLKEGDSYEKDLIYLEDLPIFIK